MEQFKESSINSPLLLSTRECLSEAIFKRCHHLHNYFCDFLLQEKYSIYYKLIDIVLYWTWIIVSQIVQIRSAFILKVHSQVWYNFCDWKPFKNDEKCFLFHRKIYFRSQDILSWLLGHVEKQID